MPTLLGDVETAARLFVEGERFVPLAPSVRQRLQIQGCLHTQARMHSSVSSVRMSTSVSMRQSGRPTHLAKNVVGQRAFLTQRHNQRLVREVGRRHLPLEQLIKVGRARPGDDSRLALHEEEEMVEEEEGSY